MPMEFAGACAPPRACHGRGWLTLAQPNPQWAHLGKSSLRNERTPGSAWAQLALHSAAGQERFKPVDVVVAIDHVLLAYERAEQGQGRFDAVDDEFVERALEPHQAFAAGLAVYDQLAD